MYSAYTGLIPLPHSLDGGGIRLGLSPFRFETMWLKSEGFKDLLRGWWLGLSFRGFASYILAAKLKALKGILKTWNKEVFGNVGTKKAKALHRVTFWDNREKERELSLVESKERVKARMITKNGHSWRRFLGGKSPENCA